jgi:hypothetical protein
MFISYFGFIYAFIMVFILLFIDNKELYLILLTLSSALLLDVGYFLNLGIIKIDYYEFSMVFYILYSILFSLKHIKISTKKLISIIVFQIFLITSYIYNFIFEISKTTKIVSVNIGYDAIFRNTDLLSSPSFQISNIKSILGMIFFIIFIILSNKKIILNLNFFVEKIVLFIKLEFIFIFIESIINKIDITLMRNFINVFFGLRDNQIAYVPNRFIMNGFGTFSEPSHISYFLFIFYNFYFFFGKHIEKNNVFFILSFYVAFVSGSTSAIVVSIYGLFLFIIKKVNLKNFLYILATLIIVFLLVNFIFDEISQYFRINFIRIMGFLNSTNVRGISEVVRMQSLIYTMKAGFENLIFGVFLGSTTAKGFTSTIFSNFGLFGSLIYFYMLKVLFNLKYSKNVLFLILYFFMLLFFGQLNFIYSPIIIILVMPFFVNKLNERKIFNEL